MTPDVPDELLSLLADPETHEAVTRASEAQLAAIREALANDKARRHDGQPAPEKIEGAFLAQGGRVAYLIVDGIPDFLIDDRIDLEDPV